MDQLCRQGGGGEGGTRAEVLALVCTGFGVWERVAVPASSAARGMHVQWVRRPRRWFWVPPPPPQELQDCTRSTARDFKEEREQGMMRIV